jgi:hypothetical protein
MRAAGTILGLLLLAVVLSDAFEVMLLPRRVRRKMRLVTLSAPLHMVRVVVGGGYLLTPRPQT